LGETFPNFLSKDAHKYLHDKMCGPGSADDFYWLYSPKVANEINPNDEEFFFGHTLYHSGAKEWKAHVSPFYDNLAAPILGAFRFEWIFRIRCNLYTNTGGQQKHEFHRDVDFDHNVLIYSLNTNNGYTEFEDGEIIESVANQAVIFNGRRKHRSVTQTDSKIRVNVNIVFK